VLEGRGLPGEELLVGLPAGRAYDPYALLVRTSE
jgi:hypothetical protein